MPKFTVSKLRDFQISRDGRTAVLHFVGAADEDPVSLEMTTLELEIATQEMGSLLTKARELSDVSKQGIVPIFCPTHCRASPTEDSRVALEFRLNNGLEHRYGLEPNHAAELARQILDVAERGRKAIPPSQH